MTLTEFLTAHLPREMKSQRGKKRLRKKKAKKILIARWERLQRADDFFMNLVAESAISSAMDAVMDAFCSIPRRRYFRRSFFASKYNSEEKHLSPLTL